MRVKVVFTSIPNPNPNPNPSLPTPNLPGRVLGRGELL